MEKQIGRLISEADNLAYNNSHKAAELKLLEANTMALLLIAEKIQALNANLDKLIGVSLDGATFLKTDDPDEKY